MRDTSGYYYVQAHRPDADSEVATLQKRARSRAMADLSSIDSIDADVARGKAADPIRHQGRIMPVQTGPGEPGWSWNAYTLELHGDVQPDQTVTIHLLPPWGTRILKIVRLLVLFGSLWALYRVLPGGFLPRRPQDPEATRNRCRQHLHDSHDRYGRDAGGPDGPHPGLACPAGTGGLGLQY